MKDRAWKAACLSVFLLSGCGAGKSPNMEQKYKQAIAANELPDQSGSKEEGRKMEQAFLYRSASAWEQIEILEEKDMKTELLDGLFLTRPGLLYRPNDIVSVALKKLPEHTVIQLGLEEYEWKKKSYTPVAEKEASEWKGVFIRLPEAENKLYRLTMNVLDKESYQSLDKVQYRFYVPYQTAKVNAKLTAVETVNDKTLTLNVINWGPAFLEVNAKYSMSKWNGDEWEHVYPTGPQTDEYGYSSLPPGEQLKKEIDISDLKPGLYRLENGIIAEPTDMREGQQLAIIFEVGEK